jgi:mono/diheme cytochrome c family protein
MARPRLTLNAYAVFAAWALCCSPAVAAPVDFLREVRPIFEAKCFKCHGPEKQKSGFRLDASQVALRGGESHAPNIVPGQPDRSPLLRFISGAEPEMRMPPKGDLLTSGEQATLRAWIAEGAVWPAAADVAVADPRDWWAWRPLLKPEAPAEGAAAIDHFVRGKLAAQGLVPSPSASADTLIRRVTLDLTGLPPTPEETAAFATDPSPQAYERLVDRLLASPRYGERWARHWLDVVHYGDTHGYDKDKPREHAWAYRDYVIRALNADKPYARFVQEQVAGDALFPGTRDGVEALGFLAAGPWDFIGHAEVPETKVDGKLARHLDRDDMVANALGTFTSLTVHCAQCHAHKFDPISQEDYYSLQAVFAALDRTDRPYYPDDATNAKAEELRRRRAELEARLRALETPAVAAAGPAYAALTRKLEGISKAAAAKAGNPTPDFGYHAQVAARPETVKWVQVDLGRRTELAEVVLAPCFDDFNGIGAGFGFPVRFKVEVSDDPAFRQGVQLLWRGHDQTFMMDFPNPGLTPYVAKVDPEDGIAGRYVRVTAVKLAPRKGDFILALAELEVRTADGRNVAQGRPVQAADSIEAHPRWRKVNLTDGLAPVRPSAAEAAKLRAERDALLRAALAPAAAAELAAARAEAAQVAAEVARLPKPALVYAGGIHHGSGTFTGTGAQGGRPRPIFLLARGQVTQPMREVGPGAVAAFDFAPARFALPADAGESARRAALAGWLTHPDNPLVWRSVVNRVWQYHFGRGIVDTANDFGRNGSPPTHPELLDWLARDFRNHGGSLKRLHRQIVLSATYRQSSADDPASSRVDAGNTWLWRQQRRKLEAEVLRDAVLQATGKLDLTMGGPGWRDFVVERPEHSPHYRYDLADPANPQTFRRAIYRFVVRSQTQPWMTSLDCADPSMRVDKRNESLSPLQALALLNNGFMLTQSTILAERVARERGEVKAQVARAYELVLGRPPSPATLERLVVFTREQGLPATCRALFNLNEFAFVD